MCDALQTKSVCGVCRLTKDGGEEDRYVLHIHTYTYSVLYFINISFPNCPSVYRHPWGILEVSGAESWLRGEGKSFTDQFHA